MIDLMRITEIRSLIWRLGRRLYCWARRDVTNNPTFNGEYWLIEKLLGDLAGNTEILMDIGANQGNWTAQARGILDRFGKRGLIYAFEPTQSTYAFLSDRFKADACVKLNKIALSEHTGEAEFFVVGELAGTNSLHNTQGAVAEKVLTQRFDDFLASVGLETVLFVKCDTEGHDMSVLRGAEKSLRAGSIGVWQFEYNHRWVANHSMLKDVFDFIEDKPYRLGKLYGNGIEIYEKWHPELERFFEANYVLVRNGCSIENLSTPTRFDANNTLVPVR
ncbi:FkbM family methyltransferase [Sulfuriflexus mobilis]|uniref:FkbM family methyltransferase n=1 Tax=Sulfuriflexus mobilis TaxID=1811807 RepID=UPI000F846012|nr:FkbM family methyltransferase [Sulfuriflexus mobilis]